MNKLIAYFSGEFSQKMIRQLMLDQKRWGNTWLERTRDGQEERIWERYEDYFVNFYLDGEDIPWLKIVGNAVIAQARIDHPEWFSVLTESENGV
jgi:hypothetical protein